MMAAGAPAPPPADVQTIRIDARRPTASVRPDAALGWSLDGGDAGSSAPLFDPRNRATLRRLAIHPVSYRLRTELAGEVWHWSAQGRWSDPSHGQGYWTGDAGRLDASSVSFGYRLPRRGNSRDEANDDGYSRLDDGDPTSFWKSDPFLPESGRPEWVKIDLGSEVAVDGVALDWRDPFARHLSVQFWQGEDPWSGRWITFPAGDVRLAHGGPMALRLAPAPRPVRYLRLLLDEPSRTAPAGSTDPRDARGYAIAEVRVGAWKGADLVDAVVHAADGRRQTQITVSSTDPWHRATDRDPRIEQPSPLALARLGLLPAGRTMLPVGLLYDTPDSAAAELAYFRRFGLAPREVELGEEPEGQRTDPEVYAGLYAALAARLRGDDPALQPLGPSLINVLADTRLDDDPERSWTRRMLRALRAEAPSAPLAGFTLEHYPDDDLCGDASARLRREPAVMAALFDRLGREGWPPGAPLALTEIGQSAYTGVADVEWPSALFAAEAMAEFLTRGGRSAYLYSLTPAAPSPSAKACAGAGEMMAYQLDGAGRARWPTPSLHSFELVSQVWLQPGAQASRLFRVGGGSSQRGPVLAYAARRPDGRWSVLLANPTDAPRRVRLRFDGGGPDAVRRTTRWTYGEDQYRWSPTTQAPARDRPPSRTPGAPWADPLDLPRHSLTVLADGQSG